MRHELLDVVNVEQTRPAVKCCVPVITNVSCETDAELMAAFEARGRDVGETNAYSGLDCSAAKRRRGQVCTRAPRLVCAMCVYGDASLDKVVVQQTCLRILMRTEWHDSMRVLSKHRRTSVRQSMKRMMGNVLRNWKQVAADGELTDAQLRAPAASMDFCSMQ